MMAIRERKKRNRNKANVTNKAAVTVLKMSMFVPSASLNSDSIPRRKSASHALNCTTKAASHALTNAAPAIANRENTWTIVPNAETAMKPTLRTA